MEAMSGAVARRCSDQFAEAAVTRSNAAGYGARCRLGQASSPDCPGGSGFFTRSASNIRSEHRQRIKGISTNAEPVSWAQQHELANYARTTCEARPSVKYEAIVDCSET